MENFLQQYRFKVVKPYLIGDVLDFGGNEGELNKYVKGKYVVVNYDHSLMYESNWDTIVSLAVIEHINFSDVFSIFKNFKKILNPDGRIFLTTPTKISKPLLEALASIGVLEKENIAEHKHYWSKDEIYELAERSGFVVKEYRQFQLGFNQSAVFVHAK